MTFFSGVQVTCVLARLYSAWPDFMRALARSAKSPGESAIGPTLCRSARIPLPGVYAFELTKDFVGVDLEKYGVSFFCIRGSISYFEVSYSSGDPYS